VGAVDCQHEPVGLFRSSPWRRFFFSVGATGKSAQIPLFVWLPDAMAGPTPVQRADPCCDHGYRRRLHDRAHECVFLDGAGVMHLIAFIGVATALVAATIALTQNDIKKVLAYSTVSQLGYMFIGVGVGGYARRFSI
jgi:NADH-quinone oxidoreductase subunit L